jgi:GNAT superfamily N-acetyltransferase
MTLLRKGTRPISVDGIAYRWIVSPDDEPGLGIVVEQAAAPGARMITWVEHGNIISPWLVRKAILHALAQGWQPQKPGQEIRFRLAGRITKDADDVASELLLRGYQAEDDQAVWHLHNLALDQVEVHRGDGKWDDDLRDIPGFYHDRRAFIVGCLNQQVIAMGAFKPVSEQVAEIRRMRVHPDFQRRGYGQQLLEYLETLAVKSGHKILTLHTTSSQIAAQRLYANNGYVEISRQPWRNMERIYFEKRFLGVAES